MVSLVFLVFLVSLVFLVPVLCSSVPLQPSPNKRAQAPADSIEFPMGSKETLARNWSFHFSQVNYISLFIFVVDRDLSRNSCLTHATTVLSDIYMPIYIYKIRLSSTNPLMLGGGEFCNATKMPQDFLHIVVKPLRGNVLSWGP